MHRRLPPGVRGRERTPGKFRTTQNWVGESGSTVETALFVPPPPAELPAPLLYLSAYLERDRTRYYEALQAVRQGGDVVPWIELFLAAVGTQAADAVGRSQRIFELRERYRAAASAITSNKAITLVDLICETPIISSHAVETSLGVTRPTALKLLRQLEKVGVLEEGSPGPRGQRRYLARELMAAVTDEGAGLDG